MSIIKAYTAALSHFNNCAIWMTNFSKAIFLQKTHQMSEKQEVHITVVCKRTG